MFNYRQKTTPVRVQDLTKRRHYASYLAHLQFNRCAYCREPFSNGTGSKRDNPTVEHIKPLNSGGKDSFENYVAVHAKCNLGDRYELGMAVILHRHSFCFKRELLKLFPSNTSSLNTLAVGDMRIVVLPHYKTLAYMSFVYTYNRILHIIKNKEKFPNVRIVVNQTDAEAVINELSRNEQSILPAYKRITAENLITKDDQYLLENDMLRPPGTTLDSVRVQYDRESPTTIQEAVLKEQIKRWELEKKESLKESIERFEKRQKEIKRRNQENNRKMEEVSRELRKECEDLKVDLAEKQGGKCAFCHENLAGLTPAQLKLKSLDGKKGDRHNAVVIHGCCNVIGKHALGLAVILHNHGIRFTFNRGKVVGENTVEFLYLIDFDLNIAVLKEDSIHGNAVRNTVERLHELAENTHVRQNIVVVSTYKEIMEVVRTIIAYAEKHKIEYRHEMDSNIKGFNFAKLHKEGMVRRPCDTLKRLYQKKMKES